MKVSLRYLPKSLTKKDKIKQKSMLSKSKRFYNKGLYCATDLFEIKSNCL